MSTQQPPSVAVGDWMPRITLPSASGRLFDSFDPESAGFARVYWLSGAPDAASARQLAERLSAVETLLHVVGTAAPASGADYPSWLLDPAGELPKAFGSAVATAVLVDAMGRVASVLPEPTPDTVLASAGQLHGESTPALAVVRAPVMLLDRVIEPAFCETLMEYWRDGNQIANRVGATSGNVVNEDVKRRIDVQVDDQKMFMQIRDRLVRRVMPAIQLAYHFDIRVIEAPIVGCYAAEKGGKFRRHRDNTSSHTAHRQFALTLNLNEEFEGGEVRFPEFGRELYRPGPGTAVIFSTSLLHEVLPVTRGRRFGLFTFLSSTGPSAYAATPRLKR